MCDLKTETGLLVLQAITSTRDLLVPVTHLDLCFAKLERLERTKSNERHLESLSTEFKIWRLGTTHLYFQTIGGHSDIIETGPEVYKFW